MKPTPDPCRGKIFLYLWICVILSIISGLVIPVSALDQSPGYTANGYIKYMQTVVALPDNDYWLSNNLAHQRLNLQWIPSFRLNTHLGIRNRLVYGDFVRLFPDYASILNQDDDHWRWSHVWRKGRSYILHSAIDRAYVEVNRGPWLLRLGRHRINWGLNLVWNPNDIFNTFSYFDFDYEERPGADAVSIQYYTGVASVGQVVYKLGSSDNQPAMAGLYRFNRWNYDIQVLAGGMGEDWVLGGGWSGQIGGAAFRGEVTCFIPRNSNQDSKVLVAGISADYSLRNGLYFQLSGLYNSNGSAGKAGGWDFFAEQTLNAKTLSRGRYAVFAQVRYPFTPLITGDCATIINPLDGSIFTGPSLTFSLNSNVDFLLMGQLFFGDSGSEFGGLGKAGFTRLKYNF